MNQIQGSGCIVSKTCFYHEGVDTYFLNKAPWNIFLGAVFKLNKAPWNIFPGAAAKKS